MEKLYRGKKRKTSLRERGNISLKRKLWRGDSNLLWVCCLLFCTHPNFWWHLHFFPPFLQVMSHPEQNPCITKQLDQKPPVMQQGSNAPYLPPLWEMEGERVSGREGQRIWEGRRGRRTARTGVWLTDQHSHFPDIKKVNFFLQNHLPFFFCSHLHVCSSDQLWCKYFCCDDWSINGSGRKKITHIVTQCGILARHVLSFPVFVFLLILNNLMHQRVSDMNRWCVLI